MSKYLLIDADSKIPNLALMKISTNLKLGHHQVDLIKANISYYPHKQKEVIINATGYDGVFVSYIFEQSKNFLKIVENNNIIEGGVGINLQRKLHPTVEMMDADYSIYPENDISYGFITRGCIRNCYFCKVPKKEGVLYFNQHPSQIIKHDQVKFLDNNFLAYNGHLDILKWLVQNKIHYEFNQGLDIRLITNSNASLLSQSKYLGEFGFAFDNVKDEKIITEKLHLFRQHVTKDWRTKFFLYCNANMDITNDVIYRIKWCFEHKALPYFMRDINCRNSVNSDFYTDIAAWCNQPNLFKYMNFKEYISKRQNKNKKRQEKALDLFYSSS